MQPNFDHVLEGLQARAMVEGGLPPQAVQVFQAYSQQREDNLRLLEKLAAAGDANVSAGTLVRVLEGVRNEANLGVVFAVLLSPIAQT